MKDFTLSEMLIVSEKEKGGRRIPFHQDLTVIEGANDTGKSVILKSIYWTLGAEPASMPQRWLQADPVIVLRGAIDGTPITFLRRGRLFAAFNEKQERIGAFESVTNELAPFLASVLGFGLLITDRRLNLAPPPPAYMFLPFYIDQDVGWGRQWSSFARLQQLSDWRRQLIEYHVGIRDARWYELEHRLLSGRRALTDATAELAVLRRMRGRATKDQVGVEFNLNPTQFKAELDELVTLANKLHAKEQLLQMQYAETQERRRVIAEQAKTVELAVEELSEDRRFLTHGTVNDPVECPTCGAHYTHSFAERFAIAQDEARLIDFLAELRQDLTGLDGEIETLTEEFRSAREEVQLIDGVLSASRDGVSLDDIVRTQGHNEFRSYLKAEAEQVTRSVREAEVNVATVQKRKRELNKDTASQRDAVARQHLAYMRRYLTELDLLTLDDKDLKLTSSISESGSTQPRALLAYFFSVLNVIANNGTAFFAPIVIDEPNQQGQDEVNMPSVLDFIVRERPAGRQVVLGIESDHGVSIPGERVVLTEKLGALSRADYETTRAVVYPLLQEAVAL